jgi:hypothetical protein
MVGLRKAINVAAEACKPYVSERLSIPNPNAKEISMLAKILILYGSSRMNSG